MSSAVSWFLLSSLFFIIISYFAVYVNIFYTITAIAVYTTNWNLLITSVFLLQLSYRLNRRIELLVAPNYVS